MKRILSLALLGSCCSSVKVPIKIASVEHTLERADAPPTANDILLISDTHASNPLTPHATWSGGMGSDTWASKTAIRPAHMDAWGGHVLAWLLDEELRKPGRPPAKLVIHLGDAANIGCRVEIDEFFTIMKVHAPATPWFLAPGNHDSLAYGNWPHLGGTDNALGTWSGECANALGPTASGWGPKHTEPGELLHKTSFLDAYVEAKGWKLGPMATPDLDNNGCMRLEQRDGFAEKVTYCKNLSKLRDGRPSSPYASYLLQQIELDPSTVLILLDTTQYRKLPATSLLSKILRKTGGEEGGLHDAQLDELARWLAAETDGRKRQVVLGGHFPLDVLDKRSKTRLAALMGKHRVVAYLSSHTHDPASIRDHGGLPELNLGSVVDWPMEYARLRLETAVDSTRLHVGLVRISSVLAPGCAPLEDAWQAKDGDLDEYTSYVTCTGFWCRLRAGFNTAYAKTREGMYQRLRRFAPDAPEQMELEGFGSYSSLEQPQRVLEYERCQVLWASKKEQDTRSGLFPDPVFVSKKLEAGGTALTIVRKERAAPAEAKAAEPRPAAGTLSSVVPLELEHRPDTGAVRRFTVGDDGSIREGGKLMARFDRGAIVDPEGGMLVGVRASGERERLFGQLVSEDPIAGLHFDTGGALVVADGSTVDVSSKGELVFGDSKLGIRTVPFVTRGYVEAARREVLLLAIWMIGTDSSVLDPAGN